MNLTELEQLAKAAAVIDHNETSNWYRCDDLIRDVIFYPKNARFIAAANPETIISLIALLHEMGEALDAAYGYGTARVDSIIGKTLAKYKEMK